MKALMQEPDSPIGVSMYDTCMRALSSMADANSNVGNIYFAALDAR
jgi:hypothetical protein